MENKTEKELCTELGRHMGHVVTIAQKLGMSSSDAGKFARDFMLKVAYVQEMNALAKDVAQ